MFLRLNDVLVAPNATVGESLASYVAAASGTGFAVALAVRADLPVLALVVIGVVAFDMFGGAVVNATRAAKLRFHGPGRTVWHHLGFVAGHVQPFLLALAVPGFGWGTAAALYVLVLAGAVVVVAAPQHVRAPVAFAVTVLATGVVTTLLAAPDALAWFAPTLLVKLLLGHLLPGEGQPVTEVAGSVSSTGSDSTP